MSRVLLLGASGTIGRATAQALVADGHEVTCVLRRQIKLPGCDICVTEIADMRLEAGRYDAAISCLASRTGVPADAWAVDHGLNMAALAQAKAAGIGHFILLSAICVQKPLLEFQMAKLAFEQALKESGLGWTIVRPTAYFKSLSGQLDRVKSGKPFLLFGDGQLTACKPISDADLGRFLSACVSDTASRNRILPVGGPGPAITPLDQGRMLFEAVGVEPRFKHVPIRLMDAIIAMLGVGGLVSSKLRDKAELARIGRYYATQSMLVWDGTRYDAEATPEFGADTLADHYGALIRGEVKDDRGDHAVF